MGREYGQEDSRSKKFIDSSEWDEVYLINSYALFMGYLSMAVRGVGFLVVMWTTVVLLGGFVSTIKQKDFWCLTAIVLTETAGAFDIFMKEKLTDLSNTGLGYLSIPGVRTGLSPHILGDCYLCGLLCMLTKKLIKGLVLAIVLGPLAAVFISGLYVAAAISLWRLIEHDYGNTDESANMKPALDVLYSLVLVQGFVYGFRAIHSPARKVLVAMVIEAYKFDRLGSASVWEYMQDTMSGCEKDPTFARRRNLVTYAVDLMESNSPDSFLSGVRILDTILSNLRPGPFSGELKAELVKHTLVKHMIGSASSSPVLQKLLKALGSRSSCTREMRGRAARIAKHLAGDIRLEQFPEGIQYISSLIGTFEEYSIIEPYQRDWLVEDKEHKWRPYAVFLFKPGDSYSGDLWKGYKDLFLHGMRILRKLAADENNVRTMSHNQGLLFKIMAPVTSDLLHNVDHGDEWSSLVKGSLKVMRQLVSAPGEAGAMMRHDISGNTHVICTMKRILNCEKCHMKNRELSMRILTRLYMETQVTEDFIRLLSPEFVRELFMGEVAGEALAMLSSTGPSNVMTILQAHDDLVSYLSKVLLDVKRKRRSRVFAANILENLCIHYTKGDELCPHKLEAMIDVMPKLLEEILPADATQTGTGAGFSSSLADIEGQNGGASQANDQNKSTPVYKIKESSELREPFLSLCVTVCDTFISADPDKAPRFSAILESSLLGKLRAMVEGTSNPTADNLRMLKLTSRMVLSMVKHEGRRSSYLNQELKSLIKSLSIALKNMVPVDGSFSMYSASGDGQGDGAMETKPFRSLASLVQEVKNVFSEYYMLEESEIKELSTSVDGEP